MADNKMDAVRRKLEYYSSLRKSLKQNDEMASADLDLHLSTIATDMESDNRYIVYQCKRAYAAILKTFELKMQTVLLNDILQDENKKGLHLVCLEICTEILSRHCQFWRDYSEVLAKTLQSYCKVFFQHFCVQTLSEPDINCLYCLLRIFYKYTKLIVIYNWSPAMMFIQGILSEFKGVLVEICLSDDAMYFVKRVLIRLLTLILKYDCGYIGENLRIEVISINNLLTDQLSELDLSDILCKTDVCGFTGEGDDHGKQQIDVTHIREWSHLIITSLAKKSLTDPYSAQYLLVRLDKVVKLKLEQKGDDVLLSWLGAVFCDQDDAWIEVLQILMDFSSKRSLTTETPSTYIQNHWYFLQFMEYTGFDHGILIDFLTSPETNFLDYLNSYLKQLQASWKQFKDIAITFQRRKEMPNLLLTDDVKVHHGHPTVRPAQGIENNTIVQEIDKGEHCNKQLPDKINTEDLVSCDFKETKAISEILKRVHYAGDIATLDKGVVPYMVTALTMPDEEECSSEDKSIPKVLNGLTLISNVYSDSEDSDSDEDTKTKADIAPENDNKPLDITSEMLDPYPDSFDSTSDGNEDDDYDTNIIDSVMSALIRVRLKLERLWECKMIHFNPKPLVKLLEQVESCYENS